MEDIKRIKKVNKTFPEVIEESLVLLKSKNIGFGNKSEQYIEAKKRAEHMSNEEVRNKIFTHLCEHELLCVLRSRKLKKWLELFEK